MAYEALLSEVRRGPAVLRNRVVSTAHQTSLVHDHLPTDELVAYPEARARGRVGAVFLEATAVHATGLLTAHTIGGYLPAIAPVYERLGATVRAHGARLFVQLLHSGREQIASAPRPPAIAPSAVPTARFRTEPRALTRAEIEDLVAGYAASARLCREGGVDGIEVSMAHGYLAAQFFAPATNRRDDEWGGDLDGRLRFARAVLAAVREAAGDEVAVGVRLAADEIAPGTMGPEACAGIAAALCGGDGGARVDFVSAALGHSASYSGSTYIVPPPPEPVDAIAGPLAPLRAALPGMPLIATTRVVDLDSAERLVATGATDLVGMTRALIADPDLLAKAAAGRADDVIPCVGCNQGCIGHTTRACRSAASSTRGRGASEACRGRRAGTATRAGAACSSPAPDRPASRRRSRRRRPGTRSCSPSATPGSAASYGSPAARPRTARRGRATSAS